MEYRLNKYISASGYCSRREADKYIETGNVTVDGVRAKIGSRVLPGQKVRVNGHLIENDIEPVYIAFNKPVGVVSTTDLTERNNIIDFISHEQRIFPIGRLDKDSQGLILLTNNGDIVNKILRAGNNHKKEYVVTVNRPITKEFLSAMANGVPILDRVTRKCVLKQINPYVFEITLIQGLNRQIRRMCEYFNYEVVKLERVQVMNIKLGKLAQGTWRNLSKVELEGLFDMLDKSKDTDTPKDKKQTAIPAPKKPFIRKGKDDQKKDDRSWNSSKENKSRSAGRSENSRDNKSRTSDRSDNPRNKKTGTNSDSTRDKKTRFAGKSDTPQEGKFRFGGKPETKAADKKKKSSGPRIGKQRADKVKNEKTSNFEKYKYVRHAPKKD